jgi:hypothetical protein
MPRPGRKQRRFHLPARPIEPHYTSCAILRFEPRAITPPPLAFIILCASPAGTRTRRKNGNNQERRAGQDHHPVSPSIPLPWDCRPTQPPRAGRRDILLTTSRVMTSRRPNKIHEGGERREEGIQPEPLRPSDRTCCVLRRASSFRSRELAPGPATQRDTFPPEIWQCYRAAPDAGWLLVTQQLSPRQQLCVS